jgi:hypothetical protein
VISWSTAAIPGTVQKDSRELGWKWWRSKSAGGTFRIALF